MTGVSGGLGCALRRAFGGRMGPACFVDPGDRGGACVRSHVLAHLLTRAVTGLAIFALPLAFAMTLTRPAAAGFSGAVFAAAMCVRLRRCRVEFGID